MGTPEFSRLSAGTSARPGADTIRAPTSPLRPESECSAASQSPASLRPPASIRHRPSPDPQTQPFRCESHYLSDALRWFSPGRPGLQFAASPTDDCDLASQSDSE